MRSRINGTCRLEHRLSPAVKQVGEVVASACGCKGVVVQISPKRIAALVGISEVTVFAALSHLEQEGIISRTGTQYQYGPAIKLSGKMPDTAKLRQRLGAHEVGMTTISVDDLFEGIPLPKTAKEKKPRVVQPFQEIAALFIDMREKVIGRQVTKSERAIAFKQAKDVLTRFEASQVKAYWDWMSANQPDQQAKFEQLAWMNRGLATYVADQQRQQEETRSRQQHSQQHQTERQPIQEQHRRFLELYSAGKDMPLANERHRILKYFEVPESFLPTILEGFKRDQPEGFFTGEYVKDWMESLPQEELWQKAREVLGLVEKPVKITKTYTESELRDYLAQIRARGQAQV